MKPQSGIYFQSIVLVLIISAVCVCCAPNSSRDPRRKLAYSVDTIEVTETAVIGSFLLLICGGTAIVVVVVLLVFGFCKLCFALIESANRRQNEVGPGPGPTNIAHPNAVAYSNQK